MEIFEKIGDAASKTYKYTAEKTSKIAKETKIKMQINEYKSDIKDLYIEIGENVYEKFVKDEELDISDLQAKCEMVQDLADKIVNCKDEILKLKERRQCKNCYDEIDISANYCPNCGAEQERIEAYEENGEDVKEDQSENQETDEKESEIEETEANEHKEEQE